MSTLQQLRQNVSQAWDTLLDGWRDLYKHAAGAITRFKVRRQNDQLTPADRQDLEARSVGWGVLAAEVFDDDRRVLVRLEAPGMDADDFDLDVIDNRLVVSGNKQMEHEDTTGRYYVRQRAYGYFERTIALPHEVDVEKVEARYKNGVLLVELPKSESRRGIKVKVRQDLPVDGPGQVGPG